MNRYKTSMQANQIALAFSVLLTGCASPNTSDAPDGDPHAAVVPSDPDAQRRLKQYREASKEQQARMLEENAARNRAGRDRWLTLPESQKIISHLCSLPYGRERNDAFADAFKKYGIVAPENVQDKAKAEHLGMIPLECVPPPAPESDIADQGVSEMEQLKR